MIQDQVQQTKDKVEESTMLNKDQLIYEQNLKKITELQKQLINLREANNSEEIVLAFNQILSQIDYFQCPLFENKIQQFTQLLKNDIGLIVQNIVFENQQVESYINKLKTIKKQIRIKFIYDIYQETLIETFQQQIMRSISSYFLQDNQLCINKSRKLKYEKYLLKPEIYKNEGLFQQTVTKILQNSDKQQLRQDFQTRQQIHSQGNKDKDNNIITVQLIGQIEGINQIMIKIQQTLKHILNEPQQFLVIFSSLLYLSQLQYDCIVLAKNNQDNFELLCSLSTKILIFQKQVQEPFQKPFDKFISNIFNKVIQKSVSIVNEYINVLYDQIFISQEQTTVFVKPVCYKVFSLCESMSKYNQFLNLTINKYQSEDYIRKLISTFNCNQQSSLLQILQDLSSITFIQQKINSIQIKLTQIPKIQLEQKLQQTMQLFEQSVIKLFSNTLLIHQLIDTQLQFFEQLSQQGKFGITNDQFLELKNDLTSLQQEVQQNQNISSDSKSISIKISETMSQSQYSASGQSSMFQNQIQVIKNPKIKAIIRQSIKSFIMQWDKLYNLIKDFNSVNKEINQQIGIIIQNDVIEKYAYFQQAAEMTPCSRAYYVNEQFNLEQLQQQFDQLHL